MNNIIPKKIHYCWFGNSKKSNLIKKCIKSWKKNCPDYEIIEWNESNFNLNDNVYVKQAYENKKWAFVSDYVRLYVIYNEGGIYLDTDVELFKSLDEFLNYNSFFSLELSGYIATGLGFGAKKGNFLVKKMLNDYSNINFKKNDGSLDLMPCPIRNTKSIEKYYNKIINKDKIFVIENNAFLPPEYLCPYNPATGEKKITENTLGIHWYKASWRNGRINFQRNLLRPIKKIIGIDKFNKIKKSIKRG